MARVRKNPARLLRILVASISFVCSLAVIGINSELALAWIKAQLGPSILALCAGVGLSLAIVVGLQLLLAFLFGRFYCSLICPLGIMQDFIGWISRRKAKPESNYRKVRYAIAWVAFGALMGGWAIGFRIFEPFTIFSAIVSSVLDPLLITPIHGFFFPEYAEAFTRITLAMFWTGVLPLVMIIGLVVWKKRIFCTTLCPVGTLLGRVAKVGVFKLRLEGCANCKLCLPSCPAGCIDLKTKTIDNERCIRCMNCLSGCHRNAVKFSTKRTSIATSTDVTSAEVTSAEVTSAEVTPIEVASTHPVTSRRTFLGLGVGAGVAVTLGAGAAGRYVTTKLPQAYGKLAILPPGAGSAQRFFSKCTSCQLCVTHCEGKVLKPAGNGFSTVHLDFNAGMCEFTCKKCSDVCPTGALIEQTLPVKKRCRIGLAELTLDVCITVTDGTDCGACAEHCPTGALRMVDVDNRRIPELNPDLCIGCGNCEYPCPVRPIRAIVVKPVDIQVQAIDPEEYFRNLAPAVEESTTQSDEWLI